MTRSDIKTEMLCKQSKFIVITEFDKCHKWGDCSDEEEVDIGRCAGLITGIHGDDPAALYGELCAVVEDVMRHSNAEGRTLLQPQALRARSHNAQRMARLRPPVAPHTMTRIFGLLPFEVAASA